MMTVEGKIVIKLAEFKEGFFVRKKVLIVLNKKGDLVVCKIKAPLTEKEVAFLKINLELGLRKIEHKIQKEAPVTIINGDAEGTVYYDDLMIMRSENGVITCTLI